MNTHTLSYLLTPMYNPEVGTSFHILILTTGFSCTALHAHIHVYQISPPQKLEVLLTSSWAVQHVWLFSGLDENNMSLCVCVGVLTLCVASVCRPAERQRPPSSRSGTSPQRGPPQHPLEALTHNNTVRYIQHRLYVCLCLCVSPACVLIGADRKVSVKSGSGNSLWFSSNSRVNARTLSLKTHTYTVLVTLHFRWVWLWECLWEVPVGSFGFQRPVTEVTVAVTQVEVIIMVMVTGPTQPITSCSQVHLHHLISYWWRGFIHPCRLWLTPLALDWCERCDDRYLCSGCGCISVLWAAAGKVGGLIHSDRWVADVVTVWGQWVALLRLQHLSGCWRRQRTMKDLTGQMIYFIFPQVISSSKKINKQSPADTCVWHLFLKRKLWNSVFVPSDSATITAKYLTAPLASLNQEQLKRNKMEDDVTFDDLSLTRTIEGGTGGPEKKWIG